MTTTMGTMAAMGTTATTLTQTEIELAAKIATFHAVAKSAFETAYGRIGPQGAQESAEAANARNSKAKGEMASALDQMAHAETMLSEQRRRVAHDAVVTVIEMTRNVANDVYTRISLLVNDSDLTSSTDQSARERQLVQLGDVLAKLAQIASVPVWQTGSASASAE